MYAEDGTVARGRRLVQHAAVLLYADRPLNEFLSQLARTLKRGLSADEFRVGLSGKNNSLRLAYGPPADARRRQLARKCLDTAKPISIRDPKNELYTPILYGGKTLGVVSVVSESTAYSDDDLHLLQAISDYIAIAVSNQELVRSVVRPYRRLQRAVAFLLAVAVLMTLAFIVSALFRARQLDNRAAAQAQTDVNATAYRLQTYVYDAAQLSRSVASLAPDLRGNRRQTERTLFQMLGSAPKTTIYGAGLWYAPYAYDGHSRLYGPYVHRLPRDPSRAVLTYFWQNAKYNYPTQPWYKLAQSAHGQTQFTKPYFDTDLVYITSAQAFYDSRQRFLGVATVGMTYPFLQRFVASVSKPPTQLTYLTTPDGRTLAFPDADRLIAFQRAEGGHARYLSQVSAATIQRYLAARFKQPRVETTAVIPLVNWSLHESQLGRSVYDAEVGLWIWTIAALLALWLSTGLGVRALLRSRADVLERIRIELEHSRLRNEVDQRLQAEKRLRESAARDPMTALPTRVASLDAIAAALEDVRGGSGALWAVLFVDLDHFNAVNEALGHASGDDILREVAQRLIKCAGSQSVVGRYGGDEFIVLARVEQSQGAAQLADHILSALAERFTAGDHSVFLRASIGLALLDGSYGSAEEIVRDADVAMYRAKSKGTLRFEIFDAEMRRDAAQRVRMEARLREALGSPDQFFVEYQPIVRLDINAVEGFEAARTLAA